MVGRPHAGAGEIYFRLPYLGQRLKVILPQDTLDDSACLTVTIFKQNEASLAAAPFCLPYIGAKCFNTQYRAVTIIPAREA